MRMTRSVRAPTFSIAMSIEIKTVTFLENGDIHVDYKENNKDKDATIPKVANLRKLLDNILIDKIKEALGLLP